MHPFPCVKFTHAYLLPFRQDFYINPPSDITPFNATLSGNWTQLPRGANNLWTQRMQSKYGVTQSQVQCDSDAVRQVAALSNDLPSGSA